jgi:hypothetical protein
VAARHTPARPDLRRRPLGAYLAVLRDASGRVEWAGRLHTAEVPAHRLWGRDLKSVSLADWCALFGTTPDALAELVRAAGTSPPGAATRPRPPSRRMAPVPVAPSHKPHPAALEKT